MVGNTEVCEDVDAMKDWYQDVMGMRLLEEFRKNGYHEVVLTDGEYDAVSRCSLFVLHNARHDFEKKHLAEHGPYIGSIIYQAKDVGRAYDDAIWAGMKEVTKPAIDPVTGIVTAHIREPCGGNMLTLTERYAPTGD
jgi:catechol 2,3-dioxygenase-like lactoylglutathione lyase family enzyme